MWTNLTSSMSAADEDASEYLRSLMLSSKTNLSGPAPGRKRPKGSNTQVLKRWATSNSDFSGRGSKHKRTPLRPATGPAQSSTSFISSTNRPPSPKSAAQSSRMPSGEFRRLDYPLDFSECLSDAPRWEAMEIRFLDKNKCTVLRPKFCPSSSTEGRCSKSSSFRSTTSVIGQTKKDSSEIRGAIRKQTVCVEKVHIKNLLHTKREKCGNVGSSRLSEYLPGEGTGTSRDISVHISSTELGKEKEGTEVEYCQSQRIVRQSSLTSSDNEFSDRDDGCPVNTSIESVKDMNIIDVKGQLGSEKETGEDNDRNDEDDDDDVAEDVDDDEDEEDDEEEEEESTDDSEYDDLEDEEEAENKKGDKCEEVDVYQYHSEKTQRSKSPKEDGRETPENCDFFKTILESPVDSVSASSVRGRDGFKIHETGKVQTLANNIAMSTSRSPGARTFTADGQATAHLLPTESSRNKRRSPGGYDTVQFNGSPSSLGVDENARKTDPSGPPDLTSDIISKPTASSPTYLNPDRNRNDKKCTTLSHGSQKSQAAKESPRQMEVSQDVDKLSNTDRSNGSPCMILSEDQVARYKQIALQILMQRKLHAQTDSKSSEHSSLTKKSPEISARVNRRKRLGYSVKKLYRRDPGTKTSCVSSELSTHSGTCGPNASRVLSQQRIKNQIEKHKNRLGKAKVLDTSWKSTTSGTGTAGSSQTRLGQIRRISSESAREKKQTERDGAKSITTLTSGSGISWMPNTTSSPADNARKTSISSTSTLDTNSKRSSAVTCTGMSQQSQRCSSSRIDKISHPPSLKKPPESTQVRPNLPRPPYQHSRWKRNQSSLPSAANPGLLSSLASDEKQRESITNAKVCPNTGGPSHPSTGGPAHLPSHSPSHQPRERTAYRERHGVRTLFTSRRRNTSPTSHRAQTSFFFKDSEKQTAEPELNTFTSQNTASRHKGYRSSSKRPELGSRQRPMVSKCSVSQGRQRHKDSAVQADLGVEATLSLSSTEDKHKQCSVEDAVKSESSIGYLQLLQNTLCSPTARTARALGMFLQKPEPPKTLDMDNDIKVDQIIRNYQEIFHDLKVMSAAETLRKSLPQLIRPNLGQESCYDLLMLALNNTNERADGGSGAENEQAEPDSGSVQQWNARVGHTVSSQSVDELHPVLPKHGLCPGQSFWERTSAQQDNTARGMGGEQAEIVRTGQVKKGRTNHPAQPVDHRQTSSGMWKTDNLPRVPSFCRYIDRTSATPMAKKSNEHDVLHEQHTRGRKTSVSEGSVSRKLRANRTQTTEKSQQTAMVTSVAHIGVQSDVTDLLQPEPPGEEKLTSSQSIHNSVISSDSSKAVPRYQLHTSSFRQKMNGSASSNLLAPERLKHCASCQHTLEKRLSTTAAKRAPMFISQTSSAGRTFHILSTDLKGKDNCSGHPQQNIKEQAVKDDKFVVSYSKQYKDSSTPSLSSTTTEKSNVAPLHQKPRVSRSHLGIPTRGAPWRHSEGAVGDGRASIQALASRADKSGDVHKLCQSVCPALLDQETSQTEDQPVIHASDSNGKFEKLLQNLHSPGTVNAAPEVFRMPQVRPSITRNDSHAAFNTSSLKDPWKPEGSDQIARVTDNNVKLEQVDQQGYQGVRQPINKVPLLSSLKTANSVRVSYSDQGMASTCFRTRSLDSRAQGSLVQKTPATRPLSRPSDFGESHVNRKGASRSVSEQWKKSQPCSHNVARLSSLRLEALRHKQEMIKLRGSGTGSEKNPHLGYVRKSRSVDLAPVRPPKLLKYKVQQAPRSQALFNTQKSGCAQLHVPHYTSCHARSNVSVVRDDIPRLPSPSQARRKNDMSEGKIPTVSHSASATPWASFTTSQTRQYRPDLGQQSTPQLDVTRAGHTGGKRFQVNAQWPGRRQWSLDQVQMPGLAYNRTQLAARYVMSPIQAKASDLTMSGIVLPPRIKKCIDASRIVSSRIVGIDPGDQRTGNKSDVKNPSEFSKGTSRSDPNLLFSKAQRGGAPAKSCAKILSRRANLQVNSCGMHRQMSEGDVSFANMTSLRSRSVEGISHPSHKSEPNSAVKNETSMEKQQGISLDQRSAILAVNVYKSEIELRHSNSECEVSKDDPVKDIDEAVNSKDSPHKSGDVTGHVTDFQIKKVGVCVDTLTKGNMKTLVERNDNPVIGISSMTSIMSSQEDRPRGLKTDISSPERKQRYSPLQKTHVSEDDSETSEGGSLLALRKHTVANTCEMILRQSRDAMPNISPKHIQHVHRFGKQRHAWDTRRPAVSVSDVTPDAREKCPSKNCEKIAKWLCSDNRPQRFHEDNAACTSLTELGLERLALPDQLERTSSPWEAKHSLSPDTPGPLRATTDISGIFPEDKDGFPCPPRTRKLDGGEVGGTQNPNLFIDNGQQQADSAKPHTDRYCRRDLNSRKAAAPQLKPQRPNLEDLTCSYLREKAAQITQIQTERLSPETDPDHVEYEKSKSDGRFVPSLAVPKPALCVGPTVLSTTEEITHRPAVSKKRRNRPVCVSEPSELYSCWSRSEQWERLTIARPGLQHRHGRHVTCIHPRLSHNQITTDKRHSRMCTYKAATDGKTSTTTNTDNKHCGNLGVGLSAGRQRRDSVHHTDGRVYIGDAAEEIQRSSTAVDPLGRSLSPEWEGDVLSSGPSSTEVHFRNTSPRREKARVKHQARFSDQWDVWAEHSKRYKSPLLSHLVPGDTADGPGTKAANLPSLPQQGQLRPPTVINIRKCVSQQKLPDQKDAVSSGQLSTFMASSTKRQGMDAHLFETTGVSAGAVSAVVQDKDVSCSVAIDTESTCSQMSAAQEASEARWKDTGPEPHHPLQIIQRDIALISRSTFSTKNTQSRPTMPNFLGKDSQCSDTSTHQVAVSGHGPMDHSLPANRFLTSIKCYPNVGEKISAILQSLGKSFVEQTSAKDQIPQKCEGSLPVTSPGKTSSKLHLSKGQCEGKPDAANPNSQTAQKTNANDRQSGETKSASPKTAGWASCERLSASELLDPCQCARPVVCVPNVTLEETAARNISSPAVQMTSTYTETVASSFTASASTTESAGTQTNTMWRPLSPNSILSSSQDSESALCQSCPSTTCCSTGDSTDRLSLQYSGHSVVSTSSLSYHRAWPCPDSEGEGEQPDIETWERQTDAVLPRKEKIFTVGASPGEITDSDMAESQDDKRAVHMKTHGVVNECTEISESEMQRDQASNSENKGLQERAGDITNARAGWSVGEHLGTDLTCEQGKTDHKVTIENNPLRRDCQIIRSEIVANQVVKEDGGSFQICQTARNNIQTPDTPWDSNSSEMLASERADNLMTVSSMEGSFPTEGSVLTRNTAQCPGKSVTGMATRTKSYTAAGNTVPLQHAQVGTPDWMWFCKEHVGQTAEIRRTQRSGGESTRETVVQTVTSLETDAPRVKISAIVQTEEPPLLQELAVNRTTPSLRQDKSSYHFTQKPKSTSCQEENGDAKCYEEKCTQCSPLGSFHTTHPVIMSQLDTTSAADSCPTVAPGQTKVTPGSTIGADMAQPEASALDSDDEQNISFQNSNSSNDDSWFHKLEVRPGPDKDRARSVLKSTTKRQNENSVLDFAENKNVAHPGNTAKPTICPESAKENVNPGKTTRILTRNVANSVYVQQKALENLELFMQSVRKDPIRPSHRLSSPPEKPRLSHQDRLTKGYQSLPVSAMSRPGLLSWTWSSGSRPPIFLQSKLPDQALGGASGSSRSLNGRSLDFMVLPASLSNFSFQRKNISPSWSPLMCTGPIANWPTNDLLHHREQETYCVDPIRLGRLNNLLGYESLSMTSAILSERDGVREGQVEPVKKDFLGRDDGPKVMNLSPLVAENGNDWIAKDTQPTPTFPPHTFAVQPPQRQSGTVLEKFRMNASHGGHHSVPVTSSNPFHAIEPIPPPSSVNETKSMELYPDLSANTMISGGMFDSQLSPGVRPVFHISRRQPGQRKTNPFLSDPHSGEEREWPFCSRQPALRCLSPCPQPTRVVFTTEEIIAVFGDDQSDHNGQRSDSYLPLGEKEMVKDIKDTETDSGTITKNSPFTERQVIPYDQHVTDKIKFDSFSSSHSEYMKQFAHPSPFDESLQDPLSQARYDGPNTDVNILEKMQRSRRLSNGINSMQISTNEEKNSAQFHSYNQQTCALIKPPGHKSPGKGAECRLELQPDQKDMTTDIKSQCHAGSLIDGSAWLLDPGKDRHFITSPADTSWTYLCPHNPHDSNKPKFKVSLTSEPIPQNESLDCRLPADVGDDGVTQDNAKSRGTHHGRLQSNFRDNRTPFRSKSDSMKHSAGSCFCRRTEREIKRPHIDYDLLESKSTTPEPSSNSESTSLLCPMDDPVHSSGESLSDHSSPDANGSNSCANSSNTISENHCSSSRAGSETPLLLDALGSPERTRSQPDSYPRQPRRKHSLDRREQAGTHDHILNTASVLTSHFVSIFNALTEGFDQSEKTKLSCEKHVPVMKKLKQNRRHVKYVRPRRSTDRKWKRTPDYSNYKPRFSPYSADRRHHGTIRTVRGERCDTAFTKSHHKQGMVRHEIYSRAAGLPAPYTSSNTSTETQKCYIPLMNDRKQRATICPYVRKLCKSGTDTPSSASPYTEYTRLPHIFQPSSQTSRAMTETAPSVSDSLQPKTCQDSPDFDKEGSTIKENGGNSKAHETLESHCPKLHPSIEDVEDNVESYEERVLNKGDFVFRPVPDIFLGVSKDRHIEPPLPFLPTLLIYMGESGMMPVPQHHRTLDEPTPDAEIPDLTPSGDRSLITLGLAQQQGQDSIHTGVSDQKSTSSEIPRCVTKGFMALQRDEILENIKFLPDNRASESLLNLKLSPSFEEPEVVFQTKIYEQDYDGGIHEVVFLTRDFDANSPIGLSPPIEAVQANFADQKTSLPTSPSPFCLPHCQNYPSGPSFVIQPEQYEYNLSDTQKSPPKLRRFRSPVVGNKSDSNTQNTCENADGKDGWGTDLKGCSFEQVFHSNKINQDTSPKKQHMSHFSSPRINCSATMHKGLICPKIGGDPVTYSQCNCQCSEEERAVRPESHNKDVINALNVHTKTLSYRGLDGLTNLQVDSTPLSELLSEFNEAAQGEAPKAAAAGQERQNGCVEEDYDPDTYEELLSLCSEIQDTASSQMCPVDDVSADSPTPSVTDATLSITDKLSTESTLDPMKTRCLSSSSAPATQKLQSGKPFPAWCAAELLERLNLSPSASSTLVKCFTHSCSPCRNVKEVITAANRKFQRPHSAPTMKSCFTQTGSDVNTINHKPVPRADTSSLSQVQNVMSRCMRSKQFKSYLKNLVDSRVIKTFNNVIGRSPHRLSVRTEQFVRQTSNDSRTRPGQTLRSFSALDIASDTSHTRFAHFSEGDSEHPRNQSLKTKSYSAGTFMSSSVKTNSIWYRTHDRTRAKRETANPGEQHEEFRQRHRRPQSVGVDVLQKRGLYDRLWRGVAFEDRIDGNKNDAPKGHMTTLLTPSLGEDASSHILPLKDTDVVIRYPETNMVCNPPVSIISSPWVGAGCGESAEESLAKRRSSAGRFCSCSTLSSSGSCPEGLAVHELSEFKRSEGAGSTSPRDLLGGYVHRHRTWLASISQSSVLRPASPDSEKRSEVELSEQQESYSSQIRVAQTADSHSESSTEMLRVVLAQETFPQKSLLVSLPKCSITPQKDRAKGSRSSVPEKANTSSVDRRPKLYKRVECPAPKSSVEKADREMHNRVSHLDQARAQCLMTTVVGERNCTVLKCPKTRPALNGHVSKSSNADTRSDKHIHCTLPSNSTELDFLHRSHRPEMVDEQVSTGGVVSPARDRNRQVTADLSSSSSNICDYGGLENVLSTQSKVIWKNLTRLEKSYERCRTCRKRYQRLMDVSKFCAVGTESTECNDLLNNESLNLKTMIFTPTVAADIMNTEKTTCQPTPPPADEKEESGKDVTAVPDPPVPETAQGQVHDQTVYLAGNPLGQGHLEVRGGSPWTSTLAKSERCETQGWCKPEDWPAHQLAERLDVRGPTPADWADMMNSMDETEESLLNDQPKVVNSLHQNFVQIHNIDVRNSMKNRSKQTEELVRSAPNTGSNPCENPITFSNSTSLLDIDNGSCHDISLQKPGNCKPGEGHGGQAKSSITKTTRGQDRLSHDQKWGQGSAMDNRSNKTADIVDQKSWSASGWRSRVPTVNHFTVPLLAGVRQVSETANTPKADIWIERLCEILKEMHHVFPDRADRDRSLTSQRSQGEGFSSSSLRSPLNRDSVTACNDPDIPSCKCNEKTTFDRSDWGQLTSPGVKLTCSMENESHNRKTFSPSADVTEDRSTLLVGKSHEIFKSSPDSSISAQNNGSRKYKSHQVGMKSKQSRAVKSEEEKETTEGFSSISGANRAAQVGEETRDEPGFSARSLNLVNGSPVSVYQRVPTNCADVCSIEISDTKEFAQCRKGRFTLSGFETKEAGRGWLCEKDNLSQTVGTAVVNETRLDVHSESDNKTDSNPEFEKAIVRPRSALSEPCELVEGHSSPMAEFRRQEVSASVKYDPVGAGNVPTQGRYENRNHRSGHSSLRVQSIRRGQQADESNSMTNLGLDTLLNRSFNAPATSDTLSSASSQRTSFLCPDEKSILDKIISFSAAKNPTANPCCVLEKRHENETRPDLSLLVAHGEVLETMSVRAASSGAMAQKENSTNCTELDSQTNMSESPGPVSGRLEQEVQSEKNFVNLDEHLESIKTKSDPAISEETISSTVKYVSSPVVDHVTKQAESVKPAKVEHESFTDKITPRAKVMVLEQKQMAESNTPCSEGQVTSSRQSQPESERQTSNAWLNHLENILKSRAERSNNQPPPWSIARQQRQISPFPEITVKERVMSYTRKCERLMDAHGQQFSPLISRRPSCIEPSISVRNKPQTYFDTGVTDQTGEVISQAELKLSVIPSRLRTSSEELKQFCGNVWDTQGQGNTLLDPDTIITSPAQPSTAQYHRAPLAESFLGQQQELDITREKAVSDVSPISPTGIHCHTNNFTILTEQIETPVDNVTSKVPPSTVENSQEYREAMNFKETELCLPTKCELSKAQNVMENSIRALRISSCVVRGETQSQRTSCSDVLSARSRNKATRQSLCPSVHRYVQMDSEMAGDVSSASGYTDRQQICSSVDFMGEWTLSGDPERQTPNFLPEYSENTHSLRSQLLKDRELPRAQHPENIQFHRPQCLQKIQSPRLLHSQFTQSARSHHLDFTQPSGPHPGNFPSCSGQVHLPEQSQILTYETYLGRRETQKYPACLPSMPGVQNKPDSLPGTPSYCHMMIPTEESRQDILSVSTAEHISGAKFRKQRQTKIKNTPTSDTSGGERCKPAVKSKRSGTRLSNGTSWNECESSRVTQCSGINPVSLSDKIPVDIYTVPVRKAASPHRKKKNEDPVTRTVAISGPVRNMSLAVHRHVAGPSHSKVPMVTNATSADSHNVEREVTISRPDELVSCRTKSSMGVPRPTSLGWRRAVRRMLFPFGKRSTSEGREKLGQGQFS